MLACEPVYYAGHAHGLVHPILFFSPLGCGVIYFLRNDAKMQ